MTDKDTSELDFLDHALEKRVKEFPYKSHESWNKPDKVKEDLLHDIEQLEKHIEPYIVNKDNSSKLLGVFRSVFMGYINQYALTYISRKLNKKFLDIIYDAEDKYLDALTNAWAMPRFPVSVAELYRAYSGIDIDEYYNKFRASVMRRKHNIENNQGILRVLRRNEVEAGKQHDNKKSYTYSYEEIIKADPLRRITFTDDLPDEFANALGSYYRYVTSKKPTFTRPTPATRDDEIRKASKTTGKYVDFASPIWEVFFTFVWYWDLHGTDKYEMPSLRSRTEKLLGSVILQRDGTTQKFDFNEGILLQALVDFQLIDFEK